MRTLLAVSLSVIALGLGSLARAGTLVSATWTQNLHGVALTVTNAGATCIDTDPAHVPGASVVTCPTAGLQATGSATATSYNVGLTMPLFQMQVFTTGGEINVGTKATVSGAQNIAGNATSAGGTPRIAGTVMVGSGMHTMLSMWSQPAGWTILQIPLSVGVNGSTTVSWIISGSPHYITVDFYAWTPGTHTFTGLTTAGMALPDGIAMGTFDLTANGGGTVTLVSPAKISIDSAVAQRRAVNFATLKLSFVPEPRAWLLLGAGALAWLRFRRPD